MADCEMNIIVLGESGVGKTSIIWRYTKNIFKEKFPTTIVDCFHKNVTIKDKQVLLRIWDTAGTDKYRSITRQYYRLADAVLLVYDVTDITTFHTLSSWLQELRDNNEKAFALIVGNKSEDPSTKSVSLSTVKNYAREEGLNFTEASAKKGDNVEQIFDYVILKVLESKKLLVTSQNSLNVASPTAIKSPLKPETVTSNKSLSETLASNCSSQQNTKQLNGPSSEKSASQTDNLPSETAHQENLSFKSAVPSDYSLPATKVRSRKTTRTTTTTDGSTSETKQVIETSTKIVFPAVAVSGIEEEIASESGSLPDDITETEFESDMVFVSWLPPIIPLSDDIIDLHVNMEEKGDGDEIIQLHVEKESKKRLCRLS